jgi:hypothetical protein
MFSSKNVLILLFVFLLSKPLLSQSITAHGGYPYYFMQLEKYGDYTDVKNKNNYTLGLSINKYIGFSKIELGFAYGTKNYSFYYRDVYSSMEKENIQLSYYFIPVFFNHRLFSDSINTISFSLGSVFIKAFGYSRETFFKDETIINREKIPANYKLGNTLRIGIKYSKSLSAKFIFFTEIYANYKFNIDYFETGSSPHYFDLTDDRFDSGINVGIEWLFNKKELKYYQKIR